MTTPRLRPLALVLATALTAVLAAPTVDAAPFAQLARGRAQAKACDISSISGRLGSTSVTSLKVSQTSCDTGISVVRAFHSCRLAHGPQGRCVRTVKGYACAETRTSTPVQFSATVTCRKGRASVVHRYTQVI